MAAALANLCLNQDLLDFALLALGNHHLWNVCGLDDPFNSPLST